MHPGKTADPLRASSDGADAAGPYGRIEMTTQPLPHPPLPDLGELGPDPEPLGTERFERLMHSGFPPACRRPVPLESRRMVAEGVRRTTPLHREAA
jgi:hypothetical protein